MIIGQLALRIQNNIKAFPAVKVPRTLSNNVKEIMQRIYLILRTMYMKTREHSVDKVFAVHR